MMALLFASSAGAAALFIAVVTGLYPRLEPTVVPLCFYAIATTGVTALLLRHRAAFGVEKRSGWRTLRQEAGWVLATSGLLEFATVAALVLAS